MKAGMFRTSLDILHYSGLSRAAAPLFGGVGAIFMLHHVRPHDGGASGFAPNAGLDVSPDFLDAVIGFVRARGWDLVSLEEAARRLREKEFGRKFAVFTLDDGFRDNLTHALPVFRARQCPFTVFVAPDYADGKGELWWEALEIAIAENDEIRPELTGLPDVMECAGEEKKQAAWDALYWPVRRMGEHAQRRWIRSFAARHGVDLAKLCRARIMNWDEIRQMAGDPLCDMGAHTLRHYALARLDEEQARHEIVASRARLEAELGVAVTTFAYPYGDAGSAGRRDFDLVARAGFAAAVTTRKGLVRAAHAARLTALPRVSLNGFYQKIRYVDVLLTGLPFALFNGLGKLKVA